MELTKDAEEAWETMPSSAEVKSSVYRGSNKKKSDGFFKKKGSTRVKHQSPNLHETWDTKLAYKPRNKLKSIEHCFRRRKTFV